MSAMFPKKLSRYLIWSYVRTFIFLTLILLGIVYLFDTVELMRRASKFDDVPLSLVLQMGLFKLPEVGQLLLPFSILFSAMFTLWQMTRRYELIAVRAAGLSIWQILAPFLLAAFLIGIIQITVINPFGSLLLSRFETLEKIHLKRQSSLISLSSQGLWLRQDHDGGHVILHAGSIQVADWVLKNTIAVFFNEHNDFIRRIDAPMAKLESGQWTFEDAVSNRPRANPEKAEIMALATDLTAKDIEDSFASPETVSFWQLPAFIRTMEQTGFDAIKLKIHYQSLLAQPLLYMAMVLLAACVSLRPPRMAGSFTLIAGGVFIGFLIFFVSSFLQALGVSHQIPIPLAAWAPPIISILMGITIMVHLEDG